MYEDVVALGVLLPLDPTLALPGSLGTPESLCLRHCMRILDTSEKYLEICPADHRLLSDVYPLCHAASVSLIHASSSQHACECFERATSLLFRHMGDFPLVVYLLQAFNNIATRLRIPLSGVAMEAFRGIHLSPAELSDVPVALVLPVSWKILEDVSEGGLGSQRMGIEIGELISRSVDLETDSQSRHR
jgi:hypothetical protein